MSARVTRAVSCGCRLSSETSLAVATSCLRSHLLDDRFRLAKIKRPRGYSSEIGMLKSKFCWA